MPNYQMQIITLQHSGPDKLKLVLDKPAAAK